MSRRNVVAGLALAIAGCGVRAPSRIDVDTMVKAHGEADVRHDLAARIVADPKDIAARLALAALEDRTQRPSAAIEQLDAVSALSGPLGTRWHADDRARLARLLAARGRARLGRGARTALADLTRAAELGATIDARDLAQARALVAIAQLRHVDAKERVEGKRTLAGLWVRGSTDASWAGARVGAGAAEHGAFGVWLWKLGAKRAAWEELQAWHDGSPQPRDQTLGGAYLTARAWWIPPDGPPPDPEDLLGPDRCRYPNATGCDAAQVSAREPRDDAEIAALLLAPPSSTTRPGDADAWLALTLVDALHGNASWGPAFAARADLRTTTVSGPFRGAFGVLADVPGSETGSRVDLGNVRSRAITSAELLVVAAGRALRGGSVAMVRDALGSSVDTIEARALLRVVRTQPIRIDHPLTSALVAYVTSRVPGGLDPTAIGRLADGYARDPVVADHIGRDLVAGAVDAALAYAALGAMFDALGDPARARAAWQAAVDSSAEVDLQRGLAEAIARAKDPDAALVAAVTAAAASGDPAIIWVSVARSLERTGEHVHALDAARSALGLGSGRTLLDAYDVAIDASRSLDRTTQVDQLLAARARLAPAVTMRPNDPTDAAAALAEYVRTPTAGAVARLWVAARWNPRHVAVRAILLAAIGRDDARRSVIVGELVALAADRDPNVGRDAVAALR